MKYTINPLIQHKTSEHYGKTILRARGIDDMEGYLSPTIDDLYDYYLLDNIEWGVEELIANLNGGKKIFLQVDSDNDGITSAAMMYLYIKEIWPDANIEYRLHTGKQHGVIPDTVPDDVDLVLIPDAGSNQYEEHKILVDRGISIIVIDHHLSDKYSEDAIIINNQMSANYPNKSLSGAGVVYKFLQCMDEKLKVDLADEFLDLAAVGIVGDMMELKDFETRFIVSHGLANVKNFGLKTFVKKQEFSIGDITQLSPTAIAFYISPLINAIIRVGTEEEKEAMFLAFIDGKRELPSSKRGAVTGDIEIAAEKAARVATNARNRQKKILDVGVDMLDSHIRKEELDMNKIIIVPLDEDEADAIDSNLTGLVAMQLVQRFQRPVLIVRDADGMMKGSARGDNTSAVAELKDFVYGSGLFDFAEGHQGAFGVGIEQKNIGRFVQYANEKLADVDLTTSFYMVDFEFTQNELNDLTEMVFDLEEMMNIWGKGVEEPRIAVKNLQFTIDQVTVMGKTKDTTKVAVNGISFIKFKDDKFTDLMTKYDFATITLVGRIQVNEWNGRKTPQVIIEDYVIEDDRLSF